MNSGRSVAIVGAGFSGALMALSLLEIGPPDLEISLIERGVGFGRGLAYGTPNPRHLLNVRVGNMSAWPDEPGHLAEWLAEEGGHPVAGDAFISRGTYGRYIASLVQRAISRPDGARRLVLEHDEAVAVRELDGGLRLSLAMGRDLDVDAVVLATGHLPPDTPANVGLGDLPSSLYANDPWAEGALAGLADREPVLILGAGLTAVDVALALDAQGHKGHILAISRRGLAPRRHEGPPCAVAGSPPDGARISQRLRAARARARQIGWRGAVDELRPVTQEIWREADLETRRRFLRHLQPWWDVHRHRLAPAVADWVDLQRLSGRLELVAGRLTRVEARDGGVRVSWRPRGEADLATADVARVINCTGPGGDLSRAASPVLQSLIETGLVRADPLGLGLDVDAECRLIDARGRPNDRIYAVGPITRGAFWEIMAVPDIRNQVAALARRLARRLA
jgi:uncharacterized NAD(P)/FAD-binding protein YdhS